ncbi:MAG: RHS repeat-associated core domain-containing protein, partial [Allobaculum sp.]|nr:RHS repeat-associated core domain-containing protein [Allobaculum sp.]
LQKEIKTAPDEVSLPDQEVTPEQTVYTYDANGSQLTKTTSEKTETNIYNAVNQLVGFDDDETTASYAYNANGLRIEKIVNSQRINHVWDGSQQIVADIVDNQFYEAECYIRGTSLATTYNYCNGEKSEYTYYIQNAHGDVVNLTDADGAVIKSYTYDAFGVEKNINDADTNAFRYCGEYYDIETGTIYLRARYYQASIGRFTQRDSVTGKLSDPLSLNLYTYAHNNPVRGIDPSGHSFSECWQMGIDMLKNGYCGNAGKLFANYSEGVVDTLSDYGSAASEFIDHPLQTTSNAVAQMITDPLKPVRNVAGFYYNLASASYNHDWESVAYHIGGATSHTAVIGSTYIATTGITSNIPSTIDIPTPSFSTYSLTNGQVAVSIARVPTAGAISIGEVTVAANIMYAKKNGDSVYRNGGNFERMGKEKGNMSRNHDVQNEQVT